MTKLLIAGIFGCFITMIYLSFKQLSPPPTTKQENTILQEIFCLSGWNYSFLNDIALLNNFWEFYQEDFLEIRENAVIGKFRFTKNEAERLIAATHRKDVTITVLEIGDNYRLQYSKPNWQELFKISLEDLNKLTIKPIDFDYGKIKFYLKDGRVDYIIFTIK